MRIRTPIQPTYLTRAQLARLRTLDLRLLATSIGVYLACVCVAVMRWPLWLTLLPIGTAYLAWMITSSRFNTEIGLPPKQPLIPPYPHNLLHTGVAMSSWMLLGVGFYLIVTNRDSPGFSLYLVPFLVASLTLMTASNFSFVIAPPSCTRCRYELEGLTFPLCCPECGTHIATLQEAATFHKISKPWLRVAAIGCFIAPLTVGLTFSARPGLFTTRLPRPARIALAVNDPDAFLSVVTTLTPAERDRLINRILDARATAEPWANYEQHRWLLSELALGRLTPEQADRFVSEPLQPRILADGTAAVGQRVRLRLVGETPPLVHGPANFYCFFRGFEIDGITTAIEPNGPFSTFTLRPEVNANKTYPETSTIFTPERPGPLTVRARIIAITTTSPSPTITWHPDGTYTITPPPLTTHEHTAETTITITE